MRAMLLSRIVSLDEVDTPLELVDLPVPEPKPGEVLIRVSACGVCHTELDEIEGRTAPLKMPVVPGRFIYSPTVTRTRARKSALEHLLKTFFDGSVEGAVATLLELQNSELSPEELTRLKAMIEDAQKEGR